VGLYACLHAPSNRQSGLQVYLNTHVKTAFMDADIGNVVHPSLFRGDMGKLML
jgi:hypothetical protein